MRCFVISHYIVLGNIIPPEYVSLGTQPVCKLVYFLQSFSVENELKFDDIGDDLGVKID